ncbi:unnamed protein product [Jaminaea pallidilutea]
MSKFARGGARGAARGAGKTRHPYRAPPPTAPRATGSHTAQDLAQALVSLDSVSYKAYESVKGAWQFPRFSLHLDHVQSDPYAPPSKFRIRVAESAHGFPRDLHQPQSDSNRIRAVALADYLHRHLHALISNPRYQSKQSEQGYFGGKGGDLRIDKPCAQVLDRSAVVVTSDHSIEARICIGLPAKGRSIQGDLARKILTEHIPALVDQALLGAAHDLQAIRAHVECVEDQEALRNQLRSLKFVAFVRDGAVLPRKSGVSSAPLTGPHVVPFQSPSSLRKTITLPNRNVTGMALPVNCLTVCIGAGFHGKSTLLDALAIGCYNYVPGDGREFVCATPDVTSVQSEDGRVVHSVDVSNFIHDLPGNSSSHQFITSDASGATSCAASLQEAFEVGSSLVCIDEDTTASNWLASSPIMSKLLGKSTITPLEQRASQVKRQGGTQGCSIFLVCGSSSDFLAQADIVLKSEDFHVTDVTNEAHELLAQSSGTHGSKSAQPQQQQPWQPVRHREIQLSSLARSMDRKVSTRSRFAIVTGRDEGDEVHLHALPQLVDESQTRAIVAALKTLAADGAGSAHVRLCDVAKRLEELFDRQGVDAVQTRDSPDGFLARPRAIDVVAALNRMRAVTVRQVGGS